MERLGERSSKWLESEDAGDLKCKLLEMEIERMRLELENSELRHAWKRTERRFEEVLEATLDGVWNWKILEGKVDYSEHWCRLLGYEPHEVPDSVDFFLALLHPGDVALVDATMQDHFAGRISVKQCEVRLRTKSGTYQWFLDRGKVVEWDDAGRPIRMVGTITSISDRKEAEQALTASEHELRLVANNVPGPLSRVDRNLRYLFVNDMYQRIFGKQRSEIIGKTMKEVLPPELYKYVLPYISKALNGEKVTFETNSLIWTDEEQFTLMYYIPEFDEEKNVQGFIIAGVNITERKNVEKALQTNERELRLIANNVPGPVSRVDKNLRYLFVNNYYQRFLDIPVEQILGKTIAEVIPKSTYEMAEPFIQRALAGESVSFETKVPYPSGETEIGLVHFIPDFDEKGRTEGFVLIGLDITARKKAEAEREEALTRLQKLAGRLPGALYQFRWKPDGTTCFPYASDNLTSILGLDEDYLVKNPSNAFARRHFDDHDDFIASILHSAEHLSPWSVEFRIIQEDGTIRWISGNSIPEREEDGSTLWHGYIKDITDQKHAEFELQAAKDKLEQAQAVARTGNWSLDVASGQTHWSKQLFILFERSPDLGALPYPEVFQEFHPDDVSELNSAFLEAKHTGTPYSLVRRLKHNSGRSRFVRCEGRAIRDDLGNVSELYGTVTDVTDEIEREEALKVARKQAEIANRAKSEFLANMSHEIRTPLTAILGFTEVLRDEEKRIALGGSESENPLQRIDRAQTIDTISNAGKHLLAIINDILDLSKIEADMAICESVDTLLIELLREVEGLVEPTAQGKGIQLTKICRTNLPDRIFCDPSRLRQIIWNLLGNAIKFTEQGIISLSLSMTFSNTKSLLEIDVEDTGRGIDAEKVERLFQPFVQADNTVTRTHGGTGLGLYISKRLANLMGGDVTLIRSQIGKGSCFRLAVPVGLPEGVCWVDQIDSPKTIESTSVTQDLTQLACRILLAEDGVDNQKLIAFHLRKAGAIVEVAENGRIALEMIDNSIATGQPFDLLLTDIQMPEMDGYQLTQTLRARGVRMPIVALTAYALAEDRQKCMQAGCDDYESKPIKKESLLSVCKKWLERPNGNL
jgi:PAS domain S-box-containing protein